MAKIKTEEIFYNKVNGDQSSYKRNIYCNADGVFYCNLPKEIEATIKTLYPNYFMFFKKDDDRKLFGNDLNELQIRFNDIFDSYSKYTEKITYVLLYEISYQGNIKINGQNEVVLNTEDGSWLDGCSDGGFLSDRNGLGLDLKAGVFKKIEKKYININKTTYEYEYVQDDEKIQQIRYEIPRPVRTTTSIYDKRSEPYDDEIPYSPELVAFFNLIGVRLAEIIVKLSALKTQKEEFKKLLSKKSSSNNLLKFIGLDVQS